MMNNRGVLLVGIFLQLTILATVSHAQVQSIDDYNRQLPVWGTSWTPSARSLSGYNASFYTGFAPRVETPERIHVHMGRGNQTRVTIILDENTVEDYIYDLAKRAEFYRQAETAGWIALNPQGSRFTPQAKSFEQIIDSPLYGISSFTSAAHSKEQIYAKSLEVMTALNRDRMFSIDIDLRSAFLKWKSDVLDHLSSNKLKDPQVAAFTINTMLLGRVNFTREPSAALIEQLVQVASLRNENDFVLAARDLFLTATENKYDIQVLENGQWTSPLHCDSAESCRLRYTEFTAIYPTGSLKELIDDGRGNQIPAMALPGLWNFNADPGADVDNIRSETYYGFIPKLDYQNQHFGFGFHNPAVRFYDVDPLIKKLLAIPITHNTYWSVKRGGVSHGCSRLAAGHTWELRHILPVESDKMKQVYLFANMPQEFDVFDIDGDGQPEIIGVEYLLSYDLQDASNGLSREGQDLQVGSNHKLQFYQTLYGATNVFHVQGNRYIFERPTISVHTYADFEKRTVTNRYQGPDEVPLFEQSYEKDKLQFYDPITTNDLAGFDQNIPAKRLVRLFGRVRGCAPQRDLVSCGAEAFTREAQAVSQAIGRPL